MLPQRLGDCGNGRCQPGGAGTSGYGDFLRDVRRIYSAVLRPVPSCPQKGRCQKLTTSGRDADARRLSRLRRSLRKQTVRSLLSAPQGEALQKQAKNFLNTGSHRSTLDMKKKGVEYRKGPSLGKTPGLGPRCLLGRTSGGRTASFRGHTVPFRGPPVRTRLRRSLHKQTAKSLLSAPQGKPHRSKRIVPQRPKRRKSTLPTRHLEKRGGKHRRPQSRELPGLGPCCLLGKSLPFYFDVQSTITQSSLCSASLRSGPAGSCKRPCSGPACQWHRLCNSSRCRSSPRTAS